MLDLLQTLRTSRIYKQSKLLFVFRFGRSDLINVKWKQHYKVQR